MAVTVPTISELYNSVVNDLKNKLGITTIIGKTVLAPLAAVQAAKLKILYLVASNVYDNIFVDTADSEMLQRFGFVKLGRYLNQAVAGIFEIEVSGTIGATLPGTTTTFKSLDNSTSPGKLYMLDTDFTFSAITGLINVRALELGSGARLEIGDRLQLTAPAANVDSFATVTNVITTAVNVESESDYRNEVINAYQLEPQGGARTDYRIWSYDAAGVREVYPYVVNGNPGVIDLFIEALPADSTDGKGTPPPSMLTDVEAVIEFDPDTTKPLTERGRRPISAYLINFIAVTPIEVDVEISDLSDVSFLTSIKTAIETFLYNVRPYIAGADSIRDQNKGKLYSYQIYQIVAEVIGINATFSAVTLKVNTNIVTLYDFLNGDIPYIDTVTAV